MPRDGLNARLLRTHFLIERMVGLQIQHARALAIVQRFHRIIITGRPISYILIDIGRCNVIGTGQNLRRFIIVANYIWFFGGTMFGNNFHVGLMIWRLAIIMCFAQNITIDIVRINNDIWMRTVS